MTTPAPATPNSTPASARGAPPTTAQTPVNSATQECPLKAKHPCDVQKLQMKTVVVLKDTMTCELKTTKRLRGTPTPGIKDDKIRELLNTYDLVQDAIASYPSREDPHPREELEFEAKADFTGSACSVHQHPEMYIKPSEAREAELPPGGLTIKGTEFGPKKFYANRAGFDGGVGGSGILVILEIVRAIWPLYHPKLIEVHAESCGNRPKGAGGAPNTNLIGLLRIYRYDTFAIGLKVPALGKLGFSHDGTYHPGTGDWETETKRSASGGFGAASYSDERSASGVRGTSLLDQSDHTRQTHLGGSGQRTSYSSELEDGNRVTTTTRQREGQDGTKMVKEDGHARLSKIEEELKRSKGFAFFIKRNERNFLKELGGEKADLAEKIIKGIIAVAEAILAIKEFFKKLPQIGWKFDFNLSLLEGSMSFEWGPAMKTAPVLDRYWPVGMEITLVFEIVLINIELILSFGVKVKALGTGIEATISGSVGLNVPLRKEFNLTTANPFGEFPFAPTAFGKLDAVASCTVFGWSLIDARVSVKASLIMPEGKVTASIHDGVHLKGTLRLEPTMMTGYLKGPIGAPKEMTPIKIIDEHEVYKFG